MSCFNIGDTVFWFLVESTSGNVYPDWLHLCSGKVIWKHPHEEIIHVHCEGETQLYVMLDSRRHVFSDKAAAIERITSRIKGF